MSIEPGPDFLPITAIVPCYNCAETLERAVNSILSQICKPLEVIFVDDASTDDGRTLKLIRILCARFNGQSAINFKYIMLRHNVGPGAARNHAWEVARYQWIAFLDSDDSWHPMKLCIQWACLQNDSKIDLISNKSELRTSEDESHLYHSLHSDKTPKAISLRSMLLTNRICTRSVLMRKSVSSRFPEGILSEDFSLWLQMIANGYKAYIIETPLVYHHKPEYSKQGISGQLLRQQLGELTALKTLYKNRDISLITYVLAAGFSVLKFMRRCVARLMHS